MTEHASEQVNLFSPIKINTLALPNRIIMSPMFSNSAGPDGVVTADTIRHYVDRARSGVGLIMTEHTGVCPKYIHGGRRLQISSDSHVAGLKRLTDAVHAEGCLIGVQIAHAIHNSGKLPADLTREECFHMIDQFVDGARRAVEAGFDTVELHCAHTYTLADFLSRRTNRRTDAFGGDIYGRMSIHVEILRRIRESVGADYPLFARFSAEEFVVGGNTLVQTRIFAQAMENNGIDCLDVSAGVRFDDSGVEGYSDQRGKPSGEYPDGPNVYLAEDIKKYVSVPVVTVGKLGNPAFARQVIEQGRADLIALARPLVADAMWVKKVRAGRDDLVKKCLACNQCLYEGMEPYLHCMRYTCQNACPANVEVPLYIDHIYHGRYWEAYATIQRENPLPLVCGRVCNHLCEGMCTRRVKVDEPIAIRALKRYASDKVLEVDGAFPVPETAADVGKSVAVVGSGPAGLACAFYLRKGGYCVTVYEGRAHLGGMLYYGIPEYRLPKALLNKELDVFRAMGVQFITDTRLGEAITLKQLRDEYDAVYLALGAQNGKLPSIPGADADGVVTALDFLRDVAAGCPPRLCGKRVVVVGGGSVAFDAARTALRLDADPVQLFCLEARSEMPAEECEIEEAQTEGIAVNPSWGVSAVNTGPGGGLAVDLMECTSVFTAGCFAPQYNEKNHILTPADYVIFAIGQETQLPDDDALRQIRNPRGITADYAGRTCLPGVFAGGDCAAAPATVIKCVNDGKLAAVEIDSYLNGEGCLFDSGSGERLKTHPVHEAPLPRARAESSPGVDSAHPFRESQARFSDQQAHSECSRCLRCDALSDQEIL